MKRLVLVFLLPSALVNAQSIYDNITPVPKIEGEVRKWRSGTGTGHHAHLFTPYIGDNWTIEPFPQAIEICTADWGNHTGHALDEIDSSVFTWEPVPTEPGSFVVTLDCHGLGHWSNGQPMSTGWTHIYDVDVVTEMVCPSNTIDNAGQCYDINDVSSADSCPTSTDSDYVLPAISQSDTSVCVNKADGSSCAYSYVPGTSANSSSSNYNTPAYYQATMENNACYLEPDTPYDDTNNIDDLAPDPQCQDIGGGVMACHENPANVCNQDGCISGCGNVNGQFICLSQDTDGDGLADYFDPDIDGDGTPNGDDLDPDGDGTDNADFGDGPGSGGGGTTVNVDVDMSGVESRLDGTNSRLNDIKGLIGDGNQSLSDIKDELTADFITDPGGRGFESIRALFSEEDIQEVETRITELQTEISDYLQTMRTETTQLFQLQAPSASWEQKQITFKGETFNISMDRFQSNFVIAGSVVLFIAALASLSILLSGKR